MQLIVGTLNMNYNRKNKAVLCHADISKRYFSVPKVCHLQIVFYFLHELKQRSRSRDVTGWHERPVDSDVTEGVMTTRSNRMKFRLLIEAGRPQKSGHFLKLHILLSGFGWTGP